MNDKNDDSEQPGHQISTADGSSSEKSHKALTPAARRALAEAAERRARRNEEERSALPKEINGPSGPEPTRYGDWERKGIASDF